MLGSSSPEASKSRLHRRENLSKTRVKDRNIRGNINVKMHPNGKVSGIWCALSITELGNGLLAIVDSPQDLHNVWLVCKRLNELATPIVYRSLRLCLSKEDFVWSLQFIDFVKTRPTYLNMIQELSVTSGSKAFTHSEVRRKTKEFRYRCLIVIDILHNSPCLQKFKYFFPLSPP